MVKGVFKIIAWITGAFVVFVLVYLGAAFCLSRIGVNKDVFAKSEVPIYILTNGVHTDLVMPVKTEQMDWSNDIKFEDTAEKDTSVKLIAFGWGDKGFYLQTPTWADLKFSVAFKAAFALSTSAIHTTFYKELKESETCKRIFVSKEQYLKLVYYIRESFMIDGEGKPIHIITNTNYGEEDAFYEAKGSYSLFHTCNTWANDGLKSCGQKACFWTIFDTGIFYQYK